MLRQLGTISRITESERGDRLPQADKILRLMYRDGRTGGGNFLPDR